MSNFPKRTFEEYANKMDELDFLYGRIDLLTGALRAILDQPYPHRNPDGEDDYVETVRLIAKEGLKEN